MADASGTYQPTDCNFAAQNPSLWPLPLLVHFSDFSLPIPHHVDKAKIAVPMTMTLAVRGFISSKTLLISLNEA
ncbi:hypothetical protein N7486_003355 [Penicillium sp. IBT 16267x]|nr:hypothetical protein N7486_003355 [Penicillium sp. IBT 16267x]